MYFSHLHVHSHYSLLDGLVRPEELLNQAKKFGCDALALTDHGVMHGAIEFYTKAKEMGIKPIIGCELYVAPNSLYDKMPKIDTRFYHLTALVKNQTGYKNLLKLVSIGELEGFYYKPRVDKETIKKYKAGIIFLSGCTRGEIPQAVLANDLKKASALSEEYRKIFGSENFYLELQDHPELPDQEKINKALLQISQELNIPIVVTSDIHYLKLEDKKAQDVLLAIQTGTEIENEDRFSMTQADLHFKAPEEIIKNFSFCPQVFDNIKKIVDECNLELELGKVIIPYFKAPSGESSFDYLSKLAWEGFSKLNFDSNEAAKERMNYELEVIKKTGFADYFLIIQDFINFAREKGILTNTRGSAAGSFVAYVLGITNVDPLKYGLHFERFLNPERIQPPDIDLDVSDTRRQELINYITEKYGKDKVAQIITFGIMKSRLAVRDVARALGQPYSLGDQISKLIPSNLSLDESLEQISELRKLYKDNPDVKEIIDMAKKLEGTARHASTHAAGVVISRGPLTDYTPLQHSSRSEKEIITQYDMYALEKIGLLKMDILGLANLTIIKNTLRIIKKVYGEIINLESIEDYNDKKVYELLSRGETVGVFQVESSGMKRYLKELKPTDFEDIIAMLALYRPGPMDLIPQFIRRKHGQEKITYLHPRLKPILENTYNICVYQEQLMQIAHELAGFSMSEADVLRKAVGKKISSLLQSQKEKLIVGMIKNNIPKAVAEKIWNWVEPFARYGFNKGHAASYARITYQTAWLKAHYPNAFMAALLTSDFGDLDRIAIEIEECRRLKIKVLAPSANSSFVEFGIDRETGNIFFSLAAIKNVGEGVAALIQDEREENGKYKNLTDFLKRLPRQALNKKTLESLIKAGAMDCFGSRELMADNLEKILDWVSHLKNTKNDQQMVLFNDEDGDCDEVMERLNKDNQIPKEDKIRRANWEREYMGLYLTVHPLDDYKNLLGKIALTVSQLKSSQLGKRIKVCGFISQVQTVRTKIGKPMVFTKLADYHNSIEVVLYPAIMSQYLTAIQEDKVVMVEGKMDKRNGVYQIIGDKIEEIQPMEA